MLSRRLTNLVPSLILLGALPGAAFAASATERDSQFEAVKSLIDREYRLPARRQLEEFTKAGHSDAEWHAKALAWFYADRFRVSSPDNAEKSALTSQAAALERELQAAGQAGKLPKPILDLVSGNGQIIRLVNDILRTVNPDRPEPLLKAKAFTDEQRSALNQAVKALIQAVDASWAESVAKVKANAKNDEEALTGDPKEPKIRKLSEMAVDLRKSAVWPIYTARKALREIAERGDLFGLDPEPARDALQKFASKNLELLQEWDYAWGDAHAFLHLFLMDLAGDGVRFKVKMASFDEIEADTMKTMTMDVDKEFGKVGAVADEIRTLQARAWAGLFTWYRDLGREVDPKIWQRGAEKWDEFKELARTPHFRLDHRIQDRAIEVARTYMNAGRMFLAKGDKRAAMAAFSAVAGTKSNPLSPNAQEWIARSSGQGGGGGDAATDWGSQAMAEEPSSALATASAFLRTSDGVSDPAQARSMLMTAAVTLRNGILGLSNANFADTATEATPELWFRYAFVLGKLNLRWHAALAAQEGLRQIKVRIDSVKQNPWKTREGQWTAAGGFVGKLAKNAIIYAQNLLQRSRGPGVNDLFSDTKALVDAVCPEEGGKSIDRIDVIISIQDGDYDGAVAKARTFQKKYAESFYDFASLINTARIAKFQKTTDAAEIKRSGDEMLAEAQTVAERAKADLAKTTDPDQKRILKRAVSEVQRLKAIILNKQGKFAEVLTMLDATYWASPPADEDESVEMLRIMCSAALQYYRERVKDPVAKLDPAILLADWPRLIGAYDIWRAQKARLTGQTTAVEKMGNNLGSVFQSIPMQVRVMRDKPNAPAELAAIETVANRAFADLVEPFCGPSKPDNALYVGNVLWDLDEHARAVRLYEIFLASLAKDPEIIALRDTPKEVLAPLDAALNARPEFRQKWTEVRDLLIDDPQLTERILTLDLPSDQWGEKKRDFLRAVAAIRALRAEVVKARVALGASFKDVDAGLDKVEKTTVQLGREIAVVGNLAVAYSELGQKEKANAYYERLIAYDPTNPDFLAAAVELTIDRLKKGEALDAKAIEATQIKAARVREAAPVGSTTYWLAKIQGLELYAFLKDTKSIDKQLNFDAKDQSTPADSLQLLPRQPRDDKRARRARNAQATELCRRYLEVFTIQGVTVKPSFAINAVEIDGKPTAVFTPVDGTTFVAHKRVLENDTTVWFLWETGKVPPPEPEAAPEPAPAPPAVAPPAAPAPAPVQPEKAQEKKP